MKNVISRTPKPPYYAVVFTSFLKDSPQGYEEMAHRMVELAQGRPGFLGIELARGEDGLGIASSYWESEEAIATWKAQLEHAMAQQRGRQEWYRAYRVRVARVEREYGFET